MIEIERKFLINDPTIMDKLKGQRITQGYLCTDPQRTVRVRIKGVNAFITIKGVSSDSGLSRYEWEKEIPMVEAEELLELALPGIIDKTRYELQQENMIWELDKFHGDNDGLMIAEIELPSEDAVFTKPSWLGDEVTGDHRYYNSYLSEQPFKEW